MNEPRIPKEAADAAAVEIAAYENPDRWDHANRVAPRALAAALPHMTDDLTHYMESTSRLKAENEELRDFLKDSKVQTRYWHEQWETAEATMREVAEELRASYERHDLYHVAHRLADRLDPPPVVENPKE